MSKKIINEQKGIYYKNEIIENSTNRKKKLGDHKSTSRKKEEIHTTTIYGRWNTHSRKANYSQQIELILCFHCKKLNKNPDHEITSPETFKHFMPTSN